MYTYVWTDSTNTIISTNDSINDVVAGTYTFTVNDGNCGKLFSFEISQPSFIYLANKPDANNVSCFGLNEVLFQILSLRGVALIIYMAE